jgi:SAM-dependent methyltransferase
MTPTGKTLILALLKGLALPLALIPAGLRVGFIKGLIATDSRIGQPDGALRRQFAVLDMVERTIAERATAYGGGEHPKHRLMRYHDFFVDNIPAGSRVLDVGCGYGAVARSIASRVPGTTVVGIDFDETRIAQAQAADNPPNLRFVLGDALVDLPEGPWTVVLLSNVLEHIEKRVDFLRRLIAVTGAETVLIRVPLFERHWHLPMRKELGIGYFSDSTHYIEHTLDEFAAETASAGMVIIRQEIRWGEIWSVCAPQTAAAG